MGEDPAGQYQAEKGPQMCGIERKGKGRGIPTSPPGGEFAQFVNLG